MPIGPDNDSSHDPFAFMASLGCHELACSALSELPACLRLHRGLDASILAHRALKRQAAADFHADWA